MITQKWSKNVYKYWKISDCIAVILFIQDPQKQINKFNFITVTNAYSPQTEHLKNYKTELQDMYSELGTLLQEVQKYPTSYLYQVILM